MNVSCEVFMVVIDQTGLLGYDACTLVGGYQGFSVTCFLQGIDIHLQDYTMSQPRRHFDPEEGGRMFLQNIGIQLQDCVVSQPRISQFE
jgi:hypothetical protein